MNTIFHTEVGNPENQDRGAIINFGTKLILVIADGEGGLSGGAEAATMAVNLVRQEAFGLNDSDSCRILLEKIDHAIEQDKVAGETTCVIAVILGMEVCGASVGDSGAWVIGETGIEDLTKFQTRKPFLGSGRALPISFFFKISSGEKLLLATDGLLKYTSPERIEGVCRLASREMVGKELVELVRYPSGALPDDITIIFAAV